ncbi:MAG: RCS-specific HTH-type transcriptional activator RclR [Pseudomonas fluorescens]|nr:MAG: RCS-specific HTH-type transcriptional activator RclR [Pseudomonas fluorescens]
MSGDPFSDILRFTQAQSLVTGGFTAGGPWALRFPVPQTIKFFAVVKGHCYVSIDGVAEPTRFDTGDVGLLTAKRGFVLASDPNLVPVDVMSLFSGDNRSALQIGDGSDFAHIGGHVLLDPASGQLLADVLPPWIHVSAHSPQATAFRWLLEQLVRERSATLPGAQLALEQLAQLLFIQIVRAHLQNTSALPASWLRALSEPRIAPALRLMHDDPARAWRLDELARACALSRTGFAVHFKAVAGVAPLAYLTEWRMHLAERSLREGREPVAVIARTLGYSSDSAFSNAFKRVKGYAPKTCRQQAAVS